MFGVKVPLIHMPVAPGRSLAILVEVAARNQLLRSRGLNAARDLALRLDQQLRAEDPDLDVDEDTDHGGAV
jgi:HPr kinase/phosphorylase